MYRANYMTMQLLKALIQSETMSIAEYLINRCADKSEQFLQIHDLLAPLAVLL